MRVVRVSRWLLLGACVALLAACDGDGDAVVVEMGDNWFEPEDLTVTAGTEITFDNIGQVPHNAIDLDRAWGTAEVVEAGESETIVIDEPGTYRYLCTFHAPADASAGMVGSITVTAEGEEAPEAAEIEERVTDVEAVEPTGVTREVPDEFPTIQSAVDAAEPGDLVLVDEGVYAEQVDVATEQIVIRGTDRGGVIVDGEGEREMGIIVTADGVAIENMTVRDVTTNGFYWTGVTGFRGSYLTAVNAGTYGIYGFDSTDGVFEHSYASGSADAGFYIGQCHDCRTILNEVTAEHNALGFSGTNSSNSLYLVNSVWRHNGAGIVPNTLDSQRYPPSRGTVIAGNLVESNDAFDAPVLSGTWPAFGTGILLAGGIDHEVRDNVVRDHPVNGIAATPNLSQNFWMSGGNVVRGNVVTGSGQGDLVAAAPSQRGGDCYEGNEVGRSLPRTLRLARPCDGAAVPSVGSYRQTLLLVGHLAQFPGERLAQTMEEPPPAPGDHEQLPGGADAPVVPAVDVFATYDGVDLDAITRPEVDGEVTGERAMLLAGFPVAQMGPWQWYFALTGWLLPVLALLGLAAAAIADLVRREDLNGGPRGVWLAVVGVPAAVTLVTWWPAVVLVSLVVSVTYLLARSRLARGRRWLAVGGGLGTLLVLTPGLIVLGALGAGIL
jgi:plastocyanin